MLGKLFERLRIRKKVIGGSASARWILTGGNGDNGEGKTEFLCFLSFLLFNLFWCDPFEF